MLDANTNLADAAARAAAVLMGHGAREVYVFGSVARGEAGARSDLDLAVRGLPPERFFRAMSEASDAAGVAIDLIDLDERTPLATYLERSQELRRVA